MPNTKQIQLNQDELLSAIDTRMSKLGTDHDLLIHIDDAVTDANKHVKIIEDILFGPNHDNGIITEISTIKGRQNIIFSVGVFVITSVIGAIGYVAYNFDRIAQMIVKMGK